MANILYMIINKIKNNLFNGVDYSTSDNDDLVPTRPKK